MTEAEWLASTNPIPMCSFLWRTGSERKSRLFAVACLQREVVVESAKPGFEPDKYSFNFAERINLAERIADGHSAPLEIDVHNDEFVEKIHPGRSSVLDWAAHYVAAPSGWDAASGVVPKLDDFWSAKEIDHRVTLVRDIFGNPFRPVSVDPVWLTQAVVGLAEGIYADRAFERMPILADALQDAGCSHEDILNHCREPGVHVRGCWVVDLLTGRR